MSDEYSEWVPRNILYFDRFVKELFQTKNKKAAFAMIDAAGPFLKDLEGSRLRGGALENEFNNLFSVEEITKPEQVDLTNPDDDKLRELEEAVQTV